MKLSKITILTTTILVTILFTGCEKEIELPTSNSEKLIGSWIWIQSSGSFSGNFLTPSSMGYQETIEFKKSGAFYKNRDNQQVSYLAYSFIEGKSIHSKETTQLIKYLDIVTGIEQNQLQSFDIYGNDTLFLSDECHDCYGHLYVREK